MNNLVAGQLARTPQPSINESAFPPRTPQDGLIDWSKSAEDILNFVRAISKPYPGAFSWLNNEKIVIWKARLLLSDTVFAPGTVYSVEGDVFAVQCGRDALAVLDWSTDARDGFSVYAGGVFS